MTISSPVGALAASGVLRRLMLVAVAVAAIVALLSGLIVALVDGGHAAPTPTTAHAVRVDNPAVVRILTVWDAQLICHGCARDGSDVTAPRSGVFETASAGSGAFISPDGYILTADHVTEHSTNNPDDMQTVLGYAADDWANRFGGSASDWLQFYQNVGGSVEVRIATVSAQVFLSTGYTGQLQNTAQVASYQIQRVVASSPVYKQDTSIIKVEAHDMPYLTLATGASVSPGDSVTAIGFPADADEALNGGNFTALLDLTHSDVNTVNSLLTSSVQTGQVTATKNLSDGTPVYETSGIGSHGSSGGPVVNSAGQIIGFVDAGPSDNRLVFLIPSAVVAEYAHEANVTQPSRGGFMGQWTSAIDDYDATGACHLSRATSTLQQLRDQYPAFGRAQELLRDAQQQSASQSCPSPVGIGLAAGGIAGLLALVIGAALAYGALRRGSLSPVPVGARVWAGPWSGARQPGASYPPLSGPSTGPSAWQPAQQIQPPTPQPMQHVLPPSVQPQAWTQPSPQQVPQPSYPGGAQTLPPGGAYQTVPPTAPAVPSGPIGAPAQMTPGAGQPPYQAPYQQPGGMPVGSAPVAMVRVCSNGHRVPDPGATACPFCGATVWEVPGQA